MKDRKNLPSPKCERYNKVILKDKDGNDFIFNKKNYYKNRKLFFKDPSFNRNDDVWSADRQRIVFFDELNGNTSTVVIADLKSVKKYAEQCKSDGKNVEQAHDTIEYCNKLLEKGFLYLIIDGQNRETMNKDWYEGNLYIQNYKGYVNLDGNDIWVNLKKKKYPKGKSDRYYTYLHPNFTKKYPYQQELSDNIILEAIDKCELPVDLYTKCFKSQFSDLYDKYNLSENPNPVELRNSKQGELAVYKRSLMNDEVVVKEKFVSDEESMLDYIEKFKNEYKINPIDSYLTYTPITNNRYMGYSLFEDEMVFLDSPESLSSAKDSDYRDIYDKYYFEMPEWIDTHKELVSERVKLFESYPPMDANLELKKVTVLDYFIHLNDLMNPNEMFEELNIHPSFILSDEIKNIMKSSEIENFSIKRIEILDYEEYGRWLCDDVLLEEYDSYEKNGKEKVWKTPTKYFTHRRDNKNWKTRQILFRNSLLENLSDLAERGIIRVLDSKRVITHSEFRNLMREKNGVDINGNIIESYAELFSNYAKAHGFPYSYGVHKKGITSLNNTAIYTKLQNRKDGVKVVKV